MKLLHLIIAVSFFFATATQVSARWLDYMDFFGVEGCSYSIEQERCHPPAMQDNVKCNFYFTPDHCCCEGLLWVPDEPANLSATVDGTTVTLNWDADDDPILTNYILYRDTKSLWNFTDLPFEDIDKTENSFVIEDLAPNTKYYFALKAKHPNYSLSGHDGAVAYVEATTESSTPGPTPGPTPEPTPEPHAPEKTPSVTENWWDFDHTLLEKKHTDNYLTVSGDYDGDGLDDVAMFVDHGNNITRVHVLSSNGSEFQLQGDNDWWHDEQLPVKEGTITGGDYNGDGFDDIAFIYCSTDDKRYMGLAVLYSTGSSFKIHKSQMTLKAVEIRPVTGDFNNDGLDDIALLFDQGPAGLMIKVFESKGRKSKYAIRAKFGYAIWLREVMDTNDFWFSLIGQRVVAGDFNGDGFDDIAAIYSDSSSPSTTRAHVFTSNGKLFKAPVATGWWEGHNYKASNVLDVVAGDFDGDGFDDIGMLYPLYGLHDALNNVIEYKLHALFSDGSSFEPLKTLDSERINHHPEEITPYHIRISSGDYNNDGFADISRFRARRGKTKSYLYGYVTIGAK